MQIIDFDFKYFGANPTSKLIPDFTIFKKILAGLQYISRVELSKNGIIMNITGKVNYTSLVFMTETTNLIRLLHELTQLENSIIDKYLSYFYIENKGGLFEFPIVKTRDYCLFAPSSIIVNDWHFSLVNGHYAKGVDFFKRDEMISSKVIDIIEDSLKVVRNVITTREYYYEFVDDNGEKVNSDIDYAIYDKDCNLLLILEVKWKSNHYVLETDYNHKKIQNSLFEIYNIQISKHKEFSNDIDRLEKMLKSKIRETPSITYLAVDKRNQLYLGEEKMMSVYLLATLIRKYSLDGILNLQELVNEINSLNTTIEYFNSQDENRLMIEGIEVLSDQIDMDEYFKI